MKKRRPDIMRPGLKQQTPIEIKATAASAAAERKRWKYLFSLNVWKPADDAR